MLETLTPGVALSASPPAASTSSSSGTNSRQSVKDGKKPMGISSGSQTSPNIAPPSPLGGTTPSEADTDPSSRNSPHPRGNSDEVTAEDLMRFFALLTALSSNKSTSTRDSSSSPSRPRMPFEVDEEQMRRICHAVCGLDDDSVRRYLKEFPLKLWALSNPRGGTTTDTIGHLECLVGLLNDGRTAVSDFCNTARSLAGWPQDPRLEFNYAWDLFLLCIDLPCGVHRAETFGSFGYQIFRSPLVGYGPKFSLTIKQMQEVDIGIKSTSSFHKHLDYQDGTVYLVGLDEQHCRSMYGLESNKIVQKVGIESLGREILASYRSLFSEDPTWDEATRLGLLKDCDATEDRMWVRTYINVEMNKPSRPYLLASRENAIKEDIVRRKRWWRALLRDLQRQSSTQPLFFYGSLLAVFFGICAVIQTIASVWALAVALKP